MNVHTYLCLHGPGVCIEDWLVRQWQFPPGTVTSRRRQDSSSPLSADDNKICLSPAFRWRFLLGPRCPDRVNPFAPEKENKRNDNRQRRERRVNSRVTSPLDVANGDGSGSLEGAGGPAIRVKGLASHAAAKCLPLNSISPE